MCDGDVTTLTCGHTLVCIRKPCERAQETRRTCSRPTGGSHTTLSDTCAMCDPDFVTSMVGRKYQAREAKLHEELAAAVKARRVNEAGRLQDELESLRQRTHSALGAARQRSAGLTFGGDVEFPSAPGGPRGDSVPGYTSRWVGGKCIWEVEKERGGTGRPVVPWRKSSVSKTPREDGVEFLNKALEEERRRQGVAAPEEKKDNKKTRRESGANGDDDDESRDGKPLWWHQFGPVKSPRAAESAMPRYTGSPVVVAEQQPPHPLRHKRKVASWLPTEEEMNGLAAQLSDDMSLQAKEPQRQRRQSRQLSRDDRKGESEKLPPRQQQQAAESSGFAARYNEENYYRRDSFSARYQQQLKQQAATATAAREQQQGDDVDIWLSEADRKGKARKSRRSSRAVNH